MDYSSSNSMATVWSNGNKIPRKRNRSTSTIQTKTKDSSSNLNQPKQEESDLDDMTSTDRRTHPNNCNHLPSSPSKQIFQRFPSWSDLTNSEQPPSKKRRKGVAGAILSTALEAALFTSAIGYAAYNFWCGNGIEEEEATRLSPKATLSRPTIPSQTLISSPPPPPYEPPDQVSEQIRMARTTRKSQSTRPVTSHRLYATSSAQSSSTPTDSINFVLHSDPAPLINRSCHPKEEIKSINRASNSYAPVKACEPIISNESDGEEYADDDDDELKAFKAQIQGLIKEGREALASKPSIPTSMTLSSSSSSFHSPQISRSIHGHRQNHTSSHNPVVVASSDKSIRAVPRLDENVQLLHLALEKAALPSHSNWWER